MKFVCHMNSTGSSYLPFLCIFVPWYPVLSVINRKEQRPMFQHLAAMKGHFHSLDLVIMLEQVFD